MSRLSRFRILAFGLAAFASVIAPPAAQAANGDLLRHIVADTTGTACPSVGVGVAFDGANLLVSCASDNTITAVSPLDGSQVAIHPIAGAISLGALAYDNGRHLVWACSNTTTVGTIDLTTDVFTPVFTIVGPGVFGPGCFDGLAYDGSDDTIWASGDVSPSVEHFTVTGVQLSSNPVSLGNCNNSGIAVGGPLLYLANNGCSEIYQTPKDFSAVTLFASFPARLEDMECDNVSFPGFGAIWSKDAYDNELNAWEIPPNTCTFGGGGEAIEGWMTGGGSVFAGTMRVTHGFELNCDASKGGNLEVNFGKSNRFHLDAVTKATCSDDANIEAAPPTSAFDTLKGSGTGRYNNVAGATVEFTFTDAGEPGSGDYVAIKVTDVHSVVVLDVAGYLTRGNQQAHQN